MYNTKVKEFERTIISAINNSGIDPVVVELVLSNLLPEVKAYAEQAIKQEQETQQKNIQTTTDITEDIEK